MRKLWRIICWPFYNVSVVKHPDLGYGIRRRILFFSSYKDLKKLRGHINCWWWPSGSSYFPECWDTDLHYVWRVYRQLAPLGHITVIRDETDVAEEALRH